MTRHPLAIAMTVALGMLVIAPIAEAQQQAGGTSMREQRAKRMAELGKGKEEAKQEEQKPAKYPNATRVAPEAKANPKAVRNLQALQDAYEKQDMAGVIAKSEEIAAMPQSHTGRFLAPLLQRDQASAPVARPARKRKTASR